MIRDSTASGMTRLTLPAMIDEYLARLDQGADRGHVHFELEAFRVAVIRARIENGENA